ncbi:hypothetical protein [Pseudomonas putida]|jgi:hypothetical protein|uniref:Uncharacterized protein n=1 Tax=Pseudomonas putida TaxID=303 RepID=A0ABD7B9C5_PSEPU|nr:hypothetical protein [Pseudomonas putida]QOC96771.1 hypothetical protein ID616_22280 [Pseudomonas putida]
MEPFVTVPERQKPFDVGSNLVRPFRPSALARALQTLRRKKRGGYQGIVTDSVKTLYQKTHCFSLGHRHKIHLASNGKAINNW